MVALKSLFTLLFLLFIVEAVAQTDSFLQSLIDSVKAEVSKPSRSVKDSQKHAAKDTILRLDTVKATTPFHDTTSAFKTSSIKKPSDSLKKDTLAFATPAVLISKPLGWEEDTAFVKLLEVIVAKTKTQSFFREGDLRQPEHKDYLFYMLVG